MLKFNFATKKKNKTYTLLISLQNNDKDRIEKFAKSKSMSQASFSKVLLLTALSEYEKQQK